MEINDYHKLTLGEKASLLWQDALFIDRHADNETTNNLYHIKNFFVEAVVSHKENRIIEVIPFKMSDRLEKYLMRVDLKDLAS